MKTPVIWFLRKFAVLILFIGIEGIAGAAPLHVLFIGNSYTGVNNLPNVFKEIVTSTGAQAPVVKAVTNGGFTLEKHLNAEKTLNLIDEGGWDVVMLQGQSEESALSETFTNLRRDFLHGAKELSGRIRTKSPKARIVFYQTWARHADYWVNPMRGESLGKNPIEMQALIRKWYERAACQVKDALIAPVGDAWELNYKDPKALRLHRNDHSHPEFNGTYLAGLVIYGTIFHPSKLSVPFRGTLSEPDAAYLQRIATKAIQHEGKESLSH